MALNKLTRSFYSRPTLEVARELIGAELVDSRGDVERRLRIVEVEAYIGEDDPACHASKGRTARTEVMYGPAGMAYVYLIYGMYHCLNIVTDAEGFPAAVLIRAAEPLSGELEINPRTKKPYKTNGPGKLSLAIGVDLRQNGLDLVNDALYVVGRIAPDVGRQGSCASNEIVTGDVNIETSSRIGISIGLEQKWRFFDSDSKYVSGGRTRNKIKKLYQ